jgi:hypothetical protein
MGETKIPHPSATVSFEEWLVPSRSQIQSSLLQLLLMLRQRRSEIEPLRDCRLCVGLLASAGFSLWRAVFLAEQPDKKTTEFLSSVERFLETVIKDNAI